ncbi:MFS transporter [Nocardia sp. NPDC004278]
MTLNETAASPIAAEPEPQQPPGYSTRKAWLITAALALFVIVNWGDKSVLGLTARTLTADLGLTPSQYGFAASSFFFLFAIGTVAGGILVDRVKTRWMLLAMALVWSLVQFPMLGTATFTVLVTSRVVLGLAEGPATPVALHAVMKWFPDEKRDIPSSLVLGSSGIGLVVAAPLLSFVQETWGWRWCFGVMGIAGVTWALLWLCIGREGPFDGDPEHSKPSAPAVDAPVGGLEVAEPSGSYWRVFAAPTWLCFAFAGFACYFVTALLTTWLPTYLGAIRGISTIATGNLIAAVAGVGALAIFGQGVISRHLIGRGVSTRWSRAGVAGMAVVAAGACLIAFVFTSGPLQLALMLPAFALFAASYAASSAAVAQITPVAQRGKVFGVLFAFLGAAGVVAPFLTGRLVQAAHGSAAGYHTVFLIGAGLLVAAGVCVLLFANPERDARRLARAAAEF